VNLAGSFDQSAGKRRIHRFLSLEGSNVGTFKKTEVSRFDRYGRAHTDKNISVYERIY